MKTAANASGLGCLSLGGVLGAVAAVLLVLAAFFISGDAMFSPGGLSAKTGPELHGVRSHAEIGSCAACHTTPWSGYKMAEYCLGCHTDLLQDPKNFHQVMIAQGKMAGCSGCHTEHRGAQAALTILDLTRFPHNAVGYSLQVHQFLVDGRPMQCSHCHPQGYKNFDPGDCVLCHAAPVDFIQRHVAAFGSSCLNCHDGLDSYGRAFDHQKVAFPLAGKHAAVTCDGCHQQAVTLAALKATPQDCYSCHAKNDIHAGRFGQACARCHTPASWETSKIDHSLTAFPLVGKHQPLACSACHAGRNYRGTPKTCAECHARSDPHKGQFSQDCSACHNPSGWVPSLFDHVRSTFQLTGKHAGAACKLCHANGVYKGTPQVCKACHTKDDRHNGQFSQDCSACHTTSAWKPSTFDHSRSAFPLTGKHSSTACSGCHANGVYKGTPTTCFACHVKDDRHQGQLGQSCATCHTTSAWRPSTFDHSRSAFQLTGKHVNAACSGCHANGVYKGTPRTCYACHAKNDRHNGQFGQDCAACHTTAAWKPSTFDHARSAFQLTGKHVSAACSGCHANGVYKGTPRTCYACHAKNDRHNGQFGQDCGACHRTSGWLPATFDHSKSAFPLTGKHVGLACTKCHANGVFKGTPASCSACHTDPAYHRGLFGTNCAACHNTGGWLPATYSRAHTFPLNHGGKANSCRACHPSSLSSYSCFSCHSQTKMASEHREVSGYSPTTCTKCHPDGRKR